MVLLAVLAAAVLSDALFSGGLLVAGAPFNDMPAQFLAWREFGFAQLRAGHLALWNPHSFSGAAFLGAFESALLYPPNWIHLFLGLGAAVNATLWLHLFLAGALTFLWARRRGAATSAAAAAGAVYMCCGPFFLHVYAGHLPAVCVMAWTPALLACAEAWAEGGGREWILRGGVVVALQIFAGNPQFVYFDLLGAIVLAAAVAPARARLRGAAGAAAMAAVGAAESVRAGGLPRDFASSFSLPWENILTALVPRLFGGGDFPYFGRSYFWEASLYAGAATLALAALAVVRGGRRQRVFAAAAGLFLLVAVGAQTPLFGFLYKVVPGFSLLRVPARFAHLIALLAVVLCAAGLSRNETEAGGRRFALACAAGATALALAAAALGFGALAWPADRVHHAVLQILGTAVVLGALAALWSRLGRWRTTAAAGLVIAEMLLFAFSVRASTPTEVPYPEAWRQLSRGIGDARVLHDMRTHPNVSLRAGSSEAWGYSSLVPLRYARFMAATQGAPTAHANQYLTFERFPPAFALTRVRYVFVPGPEERVAELPAPMPRVSVLARWRVVGGEGEALSAAAASGFDPRREVVLEADPGLGEPSPSVLIAGEAVVVSSDSAGLVVLARMSLPGVLLVTDSYSRAWRARAADGAASYRVMPADSAFMAIPLAAGEHRIRLDYEPRTFRAGVLVSLLALAGCLAWAVSRRGRGSAS